MSDTVTLSLVSHTNAGKTTLTRTLLRRDVGEVRDAPHVTLFSEEHVLLRAGEAELRLWDTPGFGDSARLLKRLKRESNPVVWFVSQTWDRMVDRPLWCSQQALKNVREAADVVLYLVNAAEPPGAAGYLAAEMEVLSWVKKPVLVLLNQVGEVPSLAAEIQEVEAWRTELKRWDFVCGVLTLDAFTQCWVQEDRLMGMIAGVVDQAKSPTFAKLKETWHAEHVRVFEDSMSVLAEQLTASALDGEEVRTETILEKVGIARGSLTREFESARKKMTAQLAEEYTVAGNANDMLVIPAGLAFAKSVARRPGMATERRETNFGWPGEMEKSSMGRPSGSVSFSTSSPAMEVESWPAVRACQSASEPVTLRPTGAAWPTPCWPRWAPGQTKNVMTVPGAAASSAK
jgi:hypothetical protein